MADIAPPSLFGPTITMLQHAVKGAHLEHEQIANNLANVNTPNFRRSTTNFKDALQATLGIPADPDELSLQTDDDRQFQVNEGTPPVPFDPQATVDETVQMRVDQSNVDIDQETTELAANADYQSTVSQLVQQQYKFLRQAIQEQTT